MSGKTFLVVLVVVAVAVAVLVMMHLPGSPIRLKMIHGG
jgi:hypothetical protein